MLFTPGTSDVAVVLGPGGPVGTAWLLGLAAGLRHAGADLARADLLVGTSAGAIAGAVLATGRDLDELADLLPTSRRDPAGDATVMPRVLEILTAPGADQREALRQVGVLARTADAAPAEQHLASMERLVGADAWPQTPLLITAVDVVAGEPVVWNRDSGVPLHVAVAASSAAPGAVAPITIDGRRYIDGALGGGSNVHLAEGAGTLILIEPIGHLFPAPPVTGALRIGPDGAALEAFGPDITDRTRWAEAYKAGLRQSTDLTDQVGPFLS